VQKFSKESFFFDMSQALRYPIELYVEGWRAPEPLSWMSFQDGELLAKGKFLEAPGLPLLFLRDSNSHYLADDIPPSVLKVCEITPWLEFELAQACAYSNYSYELAEDAPLLLILLVSAFKTQQQGIETFELLAQSKRREILRFVGLPSSNSLAKLLRRIGLRSITPWELDDFTKGFSDSTTMKLLRHHPKPHLNHLTFLKRHHGHTWPGMMFLVDEQSHSQDISWVCRLITDVQRLSQGNFRRLERVRTKEQLQNLHDELVTRFNKHQGENSEAYKQAQADKLQEQHGTYPQAPIPENVRIKALRSWRSLLDEGRTMHHCVGVYDSMVAEGEVFIYQMHEPERLTISLESTDAGWIVGEVRGYCNANPSHHALELIHRWINSGQSVLQGTKNYSSQ